MTLFTPASSRAAGARLMNLRENGRHFDNFSGGRSAAGISRSDKNGAAANSAQIRFGADDSPAGGAAEKLPSLATSNDAREVVRVLKDEAAGLPLLELLKFEPRRIFEARKLAAYEYWGIISRDANRIKLTALGRQMAEMIAAESRVFGRVISRIPPYLEAVEWARRQKLKTLTHDDLAAFWNKAANGAPAAGNSPNAEAEAVSFFSICHAAALGVATVGKRGQPARLRIEPERLEEFLFEIKNEAGDESWEPVYQLISNAATSENGSARQSASIRRVYVSGAAGGVLKHLGSSLDLADFEGVASDEFFENDFPRSANLEILRSCQAAVFVVGEKDCAANADGRTKLANERLTEIVAALALFDGRVVIIWNSPLAPPDELRRHGSPVLTGSDEIRASFQTVKLLKAMKSLGESRNARA